MKYSIITFGCRVNQADSLRLEEDLRSRGAIESNASDADLVIVNTCSVTASADQGTRQTVRRIARENPGVRVVVTGCYATRLPEEVATLPNVIRVIPNSQKLLSGAMLEGAGELTTAVRFGSGDGPCGAALVPGVAGRTAFTLRVQTGCDEACSYCIIPATRGPGTSVPLSEVLTEIERIAASGFKEITLTGVHLGSYGRDLRPRTSLQHLLVAISELDIDVMFRISSLEPMDCTSEMVDLVASSRGRFAPHFHLPLQHASDRMLNLMRRPYTLDDYRHLVERIASRMPHVSIGSDVIVGFPGETEDDVEVSARYLQTSALTHLHVFPYSDRPGTAASAISEKVPAPVIRERGARLRRIGADLAHRFQQSQLRTVRPGLTLEDGSLVVTDNYLKVRIAPGKKRNERVHVLLMDAQTGVVVDPALVS